MRKMCAWGLLACGSTIVVGCVVEDASDSGGIDSDPCEELAERFVECVELEIGGGESLAPMSDPSCDPTRAETLLELPCEALLDPKADWLDPDTYWWVILGVFTPSCENTTLIIEDCWPECTNTEERDGADCVGPELGETGRWVESCYNCVG